MPNKKSAKISSLTLALGLLSFSVPAHAGFEWVAPNTNDNGAYQAPVVISPPMGNYLPAPAPVATAAPEIISPVIITGGNAPAPSAPAATVPVHILPTPPTSSPSTPSLSTATISVSNNAPADKVSGFGSSIPLALALHQILPTDYGSSIEPDVDMNTLVSYKGGKPWRDTLRDALAPAGLSAHEEGTIVVVSHGASATTTAEKAAPVLLPIESTQTISRAPVIMTTGGDASFAAPVADNWSAQRGDTLHKVLTEWCRRAGVELQWQAEYDYPVEASAHFTNGFEDSVRNLLAGFDAARPQPIGELHTNSNAGQMVLVVQARGNNYSN